VSAVIVLHIRFSFFSTSIKEVTLYPAFVCLFVCMLATSRKKTIDQIFIKILPKMNLWTRKKLLHFGSHPFLDTDLGIFKGFFEHCDLTFSTIGSYLWKNWSYLPENFITAVSLGKQVPTRKSTLNFGSHLDSDSGTGFTMAEVCDLLLSVD